MIVKVQQDKCVSIHAPVRVRLTDAITYSVYEDVSIHAPVRVRLAAICKDESEKLFQSTHP